MAAVSFTSATGKISWRHLGDGGDVSDGSITFWCRGPDDLRIDGSAGTVMLRANGDTLVRGANLFQGVGTAYWPHLMLGVADDLRQTTTPSCEDRSTSSRTTMVKASSGSTRRFAT